MWAAPWEAVQEVDEEEMTLCKLSINIDVSNTRVFKCPGRRHMSAYPTHSFPRLAVAILSRNGGPLTVEFWMPFRSSERAEPPIFRIRKNSHTVAQTRQASRTASEPSCTSIGILLRPTSHMQVATE